MNNFIYKIFVLEEKVREELKVFLEYFEREEGIDNLWFFKVEDIVYDIVYWVELYELWDYCQKIYFVYMDGMVEEVDGFEFFEL